jgi:hypothetical protein
MVCARAARIGFVIIPVGMEKAQTIISQTVLGFRMV